MGRHRLVSFGFRHRVAFGHQRSVAGKGWSSMQPAVLRADETSYPA